MATLHSFAAKTKRRAERLQKKHACSSTTTYIRAHVPLLVQECVLEKYVPSQSQAIGPVSGGLGRKERYFPPTEKLQQGLTGWSDGRGEDV